jgi:predicted nucleic acid-binding protein
VVEQTFAPVRDGSKLAFISVVTEIELLVQPIRLRRERELERVRALLQAPELRVIGLDRQIAKLAAEIRAEKRLGLADAAIVATALHTECDVIVGNEERCARQVRDIPYVLLDALVEEERA